MSVSIVIPTFNRARLLPRAIDSALAQTRSCEVIVCDHGSSDETPRVAASYGARIRYLRREQDRGPVHCWRDGIAAAGGELVQITYDDDWLEAGMIEQLAPQLAADVAFAYCRANLHADGDGRSRVIARHPPGKQPVRRVVQHLLDSALTISPGCALFRRQDALECLLEEVPGATGRYGKGKGVGEDLLLFLLISLRYSHYVHVPRPLVNFLAHPHSITTDAERTGRRRELIAAYHIAKQHYARQPGSLPPLSGIRSWLARKIWRLQGKRAGQV